MEKRFVYYKPTIATQKAHWDMPGMELFSWFFEMFNLNAVFVDRTETLRIPIRTKSVFPIPELRPMKKTFGELCDERARGILERAESQSATLYVFWSGGIDSTLVLISLLKQASKEQREHITVLLSEDSIAENPNFYRDHIQGRLRTEPSAMMPMLLGGAGILVTGEHNDQLFGSNVVARFIANYGESSIHAPYDRETVKQHFNRTLQDDAKAEAYMRMFERVKSAAPVAIGTNYDFFWWLNFALKWQSVGLRMLPFVAPRNAANITPDYVGERLLHFYATDEFQLWSMLNPDKKIKDTWSTYKWPCKDLILAYTGDEEYHKNKIKKSSLQTVLFHQHDYKFIDDDFRLYETVEPSEYYEPENDFIL